MKRTVILVLLLAAVVVTAIVPVSGDGVRANSGPVIMVLDVCRGAAFGVVSSVDAPVIHEYEFTLHMPTRESDFPVFAKSIGYEVFLPTLERPPKA